MSNQSAASELPAIIIGSLAVVAILFFLIVQSGGFLAWAIERAIDDGRVIIGMTKDDVISSWGRAHHAEEHSIQIKEVHKLVAVSWTYEDRQRIVHFSSGGVVICVANWDG